MSDKIPLSEVKLFMENCGLDQVIVLGWVRRTGITYTASYGKTMKDCKEAADGVEMIAEKILKLKMRKE